MKTKLLSLFAAPLHVLAGCSSSGTPAPDASDAAAKDVSGMIFAVLPHAVITYDGYQHYIDTAQESGVLSARASIAYATLIEQDIRAMGQAPSREAFAAEVAPYLEAASKDESYQSIETVLIRDYGMTHEEALSALTEGFWLQYLMPLLQDACIAQGNPGNQDAQTLFTEYVTDLTQNRVNVLEGGDDAVILDGEAVALTDSQKLYVKYSGVYSRLEAMDTIVTGVAARTELKRIGREPDLSSIADEKAANIEALENIPEAAAQYDYIFSRLGIGKEAYYAEMDNILELQHYYYELSTYCDEQYEQLIQQFLADAQDPEKQADAELPPATADDYFYGELDRLAGDPVFLNTNPNAL